MGIIIAGDIDVEPGTEAQLLIDAQPHIAAALEEPGCLAYSWAVNPARPGRILVFEEWADEAALAGHLAGAPYRDMGAHLGRGQGITGFSVQKYRFDKAEPVYDESETPRADFFTL